MDGLNVYDSCAEGSVAAAAEVAALSGAMLLQASSPHAASASVLHSLAAGIVALVIFVACGFLEIGGGYLVWLQIKDHKPWWLLLVGCVALSAYGFVATLQTQDFGRVYAVYGGLFIVMSVLWGWAVDGVRPTVYDWLGAALCCVGAAVIYFGPTPSSASASASASASSAA